MFDVDKKYAVSARDLFDVQLETELKELQNMKNNSDGDLIEYKKGLIKGFAFGARLGGVITMDDVIMILSDDRLL